MPLNCSANSSLISPLRNVWCTFLSKCLSSPHGPGYASPTVEGPSYEKINQQRYNLLGEQLSIYDKYAINWSIWLYKDIGVQGMMHTNPKSKWNTTIQVSSALIVPFANRWLTR